MYMDGLKAAEWDGICIRHDDADQRGGVAHAEAIQALCVPWPQVKLACEAST